GLRHGDFGLQVARREAQGFLVAGNCVWKFSGGCLGAALCDQRFGTFRRWRRLLRVVLSPRE
ncbi:MAG: hypothetical protein WCC67_08735, partial [Candidatus Acidiferrales bacterium]